MPRETKTRILENNPTKSYNPILGRRSIEPQTVAKILNSNTILTLK